MAYFETFQPAEKLWHGNLKRMYYAKIFLATTTQNINIMKKITIATVLVFAAVFAQAKNFKYSSDFANDLMDEPIS